MEKITKETSPFKVGVEVALITLPHRHGPRSIRKKTIEKVWENGRVILGGSPRGVYVPTVQFGKIVGLSSEFRNEHIELWTAEIEVEIVKRSSDESLQAMIEEIKQAANTIHHSRDPNKIKLAHYVLRFLTDKACDEAHLAIIGTLTEAE